MTTFTCFLFNHAVGMSGRAGLGPQTYDETHVIAGSNDISHGSLKTEREADGHKVREGEKKRDREG